MLVASLDPEIYLKSERTQRRLIADVVEAVRAVAGSAATVTRLPGHRLVIRDAPADAAERLARVFGVRAIEFVEMATFSDLEDLSEQVVAHYASAVAGHTFAVRPNRIGSHDWTSQDLAVASGAGLVAAGGRVDLSNPEVTVKVRIVDDRAFLAAGEISGVGGLPIGSQGKALALFSGGIDSPVAAYLMNQRGIALDFLHFSLGCGQADHAAGIAHLLYDRFGAGSDPILHVVELEPVVDDIQRSVKGRERQMALKGVMYRAAAAVAATRRDVQALVTGESIGQVSTQTLTNLASLDRVVRIPILRPLVGLDKQAIMQKADEIRTLEVSSRTRETCDISGGARVSVATPVRTLETVLDELEPAIDHAVTTTKSMRLADWIPGT